MIAQRRQKQSDAEKKRAYEAATKRDGGEVVKGGICQKCLRDCGPVARDHRQNRDAYNTILANLQCLGLACHTWKTEHPEDAIREGWAMPRHTSIHPSEWPARRWLPTGYGTVRQAWVLYLDAPDSGVWWVEISGAEAARRMSDAGWEVAA